MSLVLDPAPLSSHSSFLADAVGQPRDVRWQPSSPQVERSHTLLAEGTLLGGTELSPELAPQGSHRPCSGQITKLCVPIL